MAGTVIDAAVRLPVENHREKRVSPKIEADGYEVSAASCGMEILEDDSLASWRNGELWVVVANCDGQCHFLGYLAEWEFLEERRGSVPIRRLIIP